MKENWLRENVSSNFVQIQHVTGKVNLADIFIKEMRDISHFVELRDIIMKPRILSSLHSLTLFHLRGAYSTHSP